VAISETIDRITVNTMPPARVIKFFEIELLEARILIKTNKGMTSAGQYPALALEVDKSNRAMVQVEKYSNDCGFLMKRTIDSITRKR
jgi:hypothetical protein